MTVHLIKLSVGTDSIEDLASWQAERLAQMKAAGEKKPTLFHRTGQRPKREAELLGRVGARAGATSDRVGARAGATCDSAGSIYWVIKGVIQARQKLIGFGEGTRPDGRACTLILLDRELVPVRPTPRRAFQGWRYLDADDAPPDLDTRTLGELAGMPPQMRKQLAELCLI